MKILLCLGCGHVPASPPKNAAGTWRIINHDLVRHSQHVDQAHDLNRLPWPWVDSSVTLVHAYAVLEHLSITLVQSLNECHRVLKPDGLLHIKLPLFNKEESWNDPTHRWHFGRRGLDLFDPTTERGQHYGALYGVRPWRIVNQQTISRGTSLYGELEAIK